MTNAILSRHQVDCGENMFMSLANKDCCGFIGLKNHSIASLSGDLLESSLVVLLRMGSLDLDRIMAGLTGADLLLFVSSGTCKIGVAGLSGIVGPPDRYGFQALHSPDTTNSLPRCSITQLPSPSAIE